MKKLRLGIIGVGNIGSSHFKNVVGGKCPDIVITAVADRREVRRNWVVENFSEVKAEAYEADMPVIFNEGDELIASDSLTRSLSQFLTISIPILQSKPLSTVFTLCARSLQAFILFRYAR